MATGVLTACNTPRYSESPQQEAGKFKNPAAKHKPGFAKTVQLIWQFIFNKPANTVPAQPIPVQALSRAALLAAPDRSLYRLGHSTMLLKLRGEFWLTDPVFSERASPVQWMGPQRFHQTPIGIADLPPVKGVILSHDHYDHLDYAAIMQLADKVEHFLTPLGVGDTLIKWGVPAAKVQQLDWWQSTSIAGLQLVATPSQHFSGRGLFDGNQTLWASWVIQDGDMRVFFSGDTGYFDGFKAIGEKYGPFDVTLMETGAYGQDWPDIHMQPEQTLQAHLDLRGKHLMPIHNGTFDLAMHAWQEPFDRIVTLAEQAGVAMSTPQMGEQLDLVQPQPGQRWWQRYAE
ncbi:MBL fold metallo-hydrolase [Undibacterium arcticum]|uniref:MBL fold metallo-hydrolase n=1 Tax=Undibacterium arcticum TaxID=1762892 RepID=A0ABV7FAQ5_9BURK